MKTRAADVPDGDEGRADTSQYRIRPTAATPRGKADPDGLEEVEAWECHPDCPCAMFPQTASGKECAHGHRRNADKFRNTYQAYGGQEVKHGALYGDAGSASRFFYQAKAGKRDRWFFCRDCQSAHCETDRAAHQHGHTQPGRPDKPDWSHIVAHPTVKPVQLMAYLTRLVTPPGGLILDPFGGTGTTAVAAHQEGFRVIVCEQDPEYAEIIRARVADATAEPVTPAKPDAPRRKPNTTQPLLFQEPAL